MTITRNVSPFDGATKWLGSRPLGPEDLRQHVVLVNFWTYTCINWIRTAPYLRAWAGDYAPDGLLIVGVHTPEFPFERDVERVEQAAGDRGINYPIAIDNDYAIWNAFDNHYWPALYLLDRDGKDRGHHFGEGNYAWTEQLIQKLLGVEERDPVDLQGAGDEAAADWAHLRSPETYLGHGRSSGFASYTGVASGTARVYSSPEPLLLNQWALDGSWSIGVERATLSDADGRLSYRFHARDVHLVMSTETHDSIAFRVQLEGASPGRSGGVDVDQNGFGWLEQSRMYQLVRTRGPVRDRTIEITFADPGAEVYAFTFG